MVTTFYLLSCITIALAALAINSVTSIPMKSKSIHFENKINGLNGHGSDFEDESIENLKRSVPVEGIMIGRRDYPTEGIMLGRRDYPTEGIMLGKRDYFTEGILLGKRDYPTEGIMLGKRDYPLEGVMLGKRNYFTEGILLGKRDYPTEGIMLGKRDYPIEGVMLGKRNLHHFAPQWSIVSDSQKKDQIDTIYWNAVCSNQNVFQD